MQFKYTEDGLAPQYFSTTLNAPLNFNSLEHNLEAFSLISTIITIADLFPVSNSNRSSSQLLLINQQDTVFNSIFIDDSIFRQNTFIFLFQNILLVISHAFLIFASALKPLSKLLPYLLRWLL